MEIRINIKKKLGKITAINVIQNNNKSNTKEKKPNPWFNHDVPKNDNNNNIKDEKSMINPLEQFDISNTGGGIEDSMNLNNITSDSNTTFMKEMKSFINKNQKNSYVENAKKRKSMELANKKNTNNNPSYPIGVGNYSNKNKMINFDKKTANKGALPVIMKKENQKIINNKLEKNEKLEINLNQTNKNDISAINMIDEALKKIGNMNDESSILDISKTSKWN